MTTSGGSADGTVKKSRVKVGKKVGRNDPCPCGSGKKYKTLLWKINRKKPDLQGPAFFDFSLFFFASEK